ncbi:4Fe-4S binding protein [Bilophila wadsworthia]
MYCRRACHGERLWCRWVCPQSALLALMACPPVAPRRHAVPLYL